MDQGAIDAVVRPLMSGKEAQIYLVMSEGQQRVAKVYKEAQNRSFKHRSDYTEGRRVRNSREQRAMDKRSRHGRDRLEAAWRSAEVDAIYRLRAAGVRVPEPFTFVDGVLVMELITGVDGEPAPRLLDLSYSEEEALALTEHLIREVVKMLCAGIVHGDLSSFNVLMSAEGPVLIDFPQVVDPAHNRVARRLLERDVGNLLQFFGRIVPRLRGMEYGPEMWALYESNRLNPESPLTGRYKSADFHGDVSSLLDEIKELEDEAARRRESLGLGAARPARRPKGSWLENAPDYQAESAAWEAKEKRQSGSRSGSIRDRRSGRRASDRRRSPHEPPAQNGAGSPREKRETASESEAPPTRRRSRRRRSSAAEPDTTRPSFAGAPDAAPKEKDPALESEARPARRRSRRRRSSGAGPNTEDRRSRRASGPSDSAPTTEGDRDGYERRRPTRGATERAHENNPPRSSNDLEPSGGDEGDGGTPGRRRRRRRRRR